MTKGRLWDKDGQEKGEKSLRVKRTSAVTLPTRVLAWAGQGEKGDSKKPEGRKRWMEGKKSVRGRGGAAFTKSVTNIFL